MVKILKKFLGSKSDKDLKAAMPLVKKIHEAYEIITGYSNDELRAKTIEFKKHISSYLESDEVKVNELRKKIEDFPDLDVDEKEKIWIEIDQLEKSIVKKTEEALLEVLPEAFAVVKETGKRFKENEEIEVTATDMDRDLAARRDNVNIVGDKAKYKNKWMAGGTEITWDMIHYDVQLIGGIVLHQGKIAEMATGEGKTLVATLPVYLNALAGKGVHIVTVNDYLAKRDSEWMGMLFEFHGLTVDCIDKHEPHSDNRKAAYLSDITYGTNMSLVLIISEII